MPKDDTVSEADAFLAAHPDIEAIDLLMPDMCGILRGKRLGLMSRMAAFDPKEPFGVPGSNVRFLIAIRSH